MDKTSKEFSRYIDYLNSQKIESKEEFEKLLNDLIEGKINIENQHDKDSNKERSNELVELAYNSTYDDALLLLNEALKLDEENIEAYNLLANYTANVDESIEYFRKSLSIFEKYHDNKFFEENKGEFWLVFEARIYLETLFGLANCYFESDDIDEAIIIYEKIIELDNQDALCARHKLCNLYLRKRDYVNYKQIFEKFKDENSGFLLYNYALFLFLSKGITEDTNNALRKAINLNPFIFEILKGKCELNPMCYIEAYVIGSQDEATIYILENRKLLENIKGLKHWIEEFSY